VIAEERRPPLAVAGAARALHVSLNGSLAHADPELEEFPAADRAGERVPSNQAMSAKANDGSCNSCHDASNPIHL
jgi:hypothetical protein